MQEAKCTACADGCNCGDNCACTKVRCSPSLFVESPLIGGLVTFSRERYSSKTSEVRSAAPTTNQLRKNHSSAANEMLLSLLAELWLCQLPGQGMFQRFIPCTMCLTFFSSFFLVVRIEERWLLVSLDELVEVDSLFCFICIHSIRIKSSSHRLLNFNQSLT